MPVKRKVFSYANWSACGIVVLLAISGCGTPGTTTRSGDGGDDQPIMGNQAYVLSPLQIAVLTDEVNRGDATAALRLSRHFGFVALDQVRELHWLSAATELGSPLGMFNFASRLQMKGDRDSLVQARHWFQRVVESGPASLRERVHERIKELR